MLGPPTPGGAVLLGPNIVTGGTRGERIGERARRSVSNLSDREAPTHPPSCPHAPGGWAVQRRATSDGRAVVVRQAAPCVASHANSRRSVGCASAHRHARRIPRVADGAVILRHEVPKDLGGGNVDWGCSPAQILRSAFGLPQDDNKGGGLPQDDNERKHPNGRGASTQHRPGGGRRARTRTRTRTRVGGGAARPQGHKASRPDGRVGDPATSGQGPATVGWGLQHAASRIQHLGGRRWARVRGQERCCPA